MTPHGDFSGSRALFLSPETPEPGRGGGGLRSASLLEYLRTKYEVTVASFTLPYHSKHFAARVWRNGARFLRGVPPLIDRFAGFEDQLGPVLERRYGVAMIEHFWCAPYAAVIRPHADVLALDLHNVESELSAAHAGATRGLESAVHRRFAAAYKELERAWLPKFDLVLVASEEDRRRIEHPNILVYPNALPVLETPRVAQENCIVFSGNLEYHPNVDAVRWFVSAIWPGLRERNDGLTWHLVGSNANAIVGMIGNDPRIRVIGPVEDAVAAIAAARVVVVPLRFGSGTRFKILEAWAAERAVVSSTIGAEGLGARDGEQLSIADDPARFRDAVQALLDDPQRARTLAAAGRELYLNRYTCPVVWRRLASAGI